MTGYTRKISCGTLLLSLALSLASIQARCGERPRLELIARDSYLPGVPVLLRVELRDADGSLHRQRWDAVARIRIEGEGASISPGEVMLRNGIGSVLARIEGTGELRLVISLDGEEITKQLADLSGEPRREVAGDLPAEETEWSGVIQVTDNLTIPEDGTLRLLPGTLVLLDGVESGTNGTDINVEGKLESLGTRERPVTLTASDPAEAWGELDHDGGEMSIYRYTIITRAGNAPEGGHTDSGAAINADDTLITLEHSSISNISGKIMDAEDSELVMRDCLLQRSVMGPEIEGTALIFENSAIFDMRGDDDNDGIYLHDQHTGQEIRLSGCIVAGGDDDAIDTLGSDVTIEDCIVRDFADKGISLFHEDITISRCLVVGNDIGISCKTHDDEGASVTIDHVTVAGNRIGVESRNRDDEDDAEINYRISNSIIRSGEGDGAAAIRTDYDPAFFTIGYCNLAQTLEGAGGGNNLFTEPGFADENSHDFRLSAGSLCIDSGDPESPPDPDGSRSDIGYLPYALPALEQGFLRGEASGDGSIDITDAVKILSYLFAGTGITCASSADGNDDGTVDITDAIYLLTWLFAGGNRPPPPTGTCGPDPTPDELDCSEPPPCP